MQGGEKMSDKEIIEQHEFEKMIENIRQREAAL